MGTDPLLGWARRGLVALGILSIAIGAGSFFWSRQGIAAASQWPIVEGQVVEVRVDDLWSAGRDRNRGKSADTRYVPVIRYAYQAGGELREGERIWLGEYRGWGSLESVQAFVGNYPVGASVPVHVNADDAAESALIIPDAPWWPLIFVPVGILLAGLGWMIPRWFGGPRLQERHGP